MLPVLISLALTAPPANPFAAHGPVRVAASKTHLEHRDGTPFFVLADTCWTGPAYSTEAEWQTYLANRKAKGFTAIQFCMIAPWSAAPADAEGNVSCKIVDGNVVPNEAYYKRLDARFKAINDAGLLAVPVLCWALRKDVDLGMILTTEQATQLVKFEFERYKTMHSLWILAGDNPYNAVEAAKWKAVGRAVFGDAGTLPVTTHATGQNFPWNKGWDEEKWLTVLGYQSGHGDGPNTWKWLHSGPPAEYGKKKEFTRPVLNLEPPYEGHNGYQSKKPHSDFSTRRATYWSLLVHPPAGVTYGGHGVWSWHTKPGEHPTGHQGTGPAKLWSDSLDHPGAFQVGYAKAFFESLPWTKLRPAPDLLDAQPGTEDPAKFIAAAMTTDGLTRVFYAPAGSKVPVKPFAHKREPKIEWFDPRTGKRQPGDDKYTAPDAQDWVLVIQL